MTVFDEVGIVDLYCPAPEHPCVVHAVEDLAADLRRLGGPLPTVKRYRPVDERGLILVGTVDDPDIEAVARAHDLEVAGLRGQWEAFRLLSYGPDKLLVCGSDPRGTMWGVYHLCEHYLGVDPLHWWTDNEPRPVSTVRLPILDESGAPPTFRFRGWFINDEDLLTDWRAGGGRRYTTYRFYHQVTHQEIIARVLEAAVRLRQNLIIPASFIDIENPAEENLIRMVSERGLFVTQHHVEPLGVSHFGWDNYWAARGREVEPSFVANPEAWREIWTHYVRRWSRYPNVIWQFGLRGRGDRPIWFHDDRVPDGVAERGALISAAMRMQAEILGGVLGTDDFLATATLWMEGSELQKAGVLRFPEGAGIIFADFGSTQMMLDDFYRTEREPGRPYGVYHHVAYWGDGPHLAQGTSVAKLHYNYGQAVSRGDTWLSILNVSNLREFVLGTEAVARMTWDFEAFEPGAYLDGWSTRQFGPGAEQSVRHIHDRYYQAFLHLDDSRIDGQMILLDGMARRVGLRCLAILAGTDNPPELLLNDRLGFGRSAGEFLAMHREALPQAGARWDAVLAAIAEAEAVVAPNRREYLAQSWLVQSQIMMGLYDWAGHLVRAADAHLAGRPAAKPLGRANATLQRLLFDRRRAEAGKWSGWYDGDTKMDLHGILADSRRLLESLET